MSISRMLPFAMIGLLSFAALFASSPVEAAKEKASSEAKQLEKLVDQAQKACASDIERLCADVTPGEGRLMSCLDSKSDQLSSGCASSRREARAQASKMIDKAQVAFRKSCGTDVQKFCTDVPAGRGRLLDCLNLHDDELSNSCKQFSADINKKVDEYWS